MNDITYFIIVGYLLGLSLAAPPGPVNATIANESMKSKLHGTSVGAGAMTADFIFFLIVFQLKKYLDPTVLKVLYFVGGIYLLYLSFGIIRSKMPSKNVTGNYFIGLSMGLTNPFQITWWVTVGIFMVNQFTIFSAIGFFLGIVTWIILFPMGINRFLTNRYEELVKILSFITVFAFSIIILYYGITGFLR